MTQTTQFTIGAEASCSDDGVCGRVTRVVIDPLAEVVTHLVVEPPHQQGNGRLVPLDLLEETSGEIRLNCTLADFDKLDPAEETHFLPADSGYGGYGPGQSLVWPYYGLGGGMGMGAGALSMGMGPGMGMGLGNAAQPVTTDTLPVGEVAIRRGDPVQATDGDIGRVQGLVITTTDRRVTHVLLQEGHLWGRKQVAIPINAVTGVTDGIQLNITRHQVEDLPPVDLDQPKS